MKKFRLILFIFSCLLLCGCGKSEKSDRPQYEVIDGQVVKIDGESGEYSIVPDYRNEDAAVSMTPENAQGDDSSVEITDGTAVSMENFSQEEYNSLSSADTGKVGELKDTLLKAADACRDTYSNADKGSALNVDLSRSVIAAMVSDISSVGIPCTDSLGNCNMQSWEMLDEFGKSIYITSGYISGTYVLVYPDGHLTGFCLSRESGIWHLLAVSGEWEDDDSLRFFSEGRYSVGGVNYTRKGWLIYSRNTSDFDANQKANTGEYTMVRVLPYNSDYRALCERYVEPIGYFENNLFITDWSQANFGPVDFNSLYAYIFGMYNGTDMLSSYNVRSYYKAYRNTRLYVVPTDIFENNVGCYFNIDNSTLKAISDYSYDAGGYFFLGYNTDYYNVTPRTPSPEVTDVTYNSDGSLTLTVDAVNKWYGTDCAFTHKLTVMPTKTGFYYVSNELIRNENNILPENKLSGLLDVEKEKLK